MTVHRFRPKPRAQPGDVAYARTGMENAGHAKTDIDEDIQRHERILAAVGARLSEGARARMYRELTDMRDMRADAAADEAAWQELVQVLVAADLADDRPDPEE
jgi:hypothetical protein